MKSTIDLVNTASTPSTPSTGNRISIKRQGLDSSNSLNHRVRLTYLVSFVKISLITVLLVSCFALPAMAADKWTGVDESVVEKIAEEHGRVAHEPLINTDQGDLLLFVFLLAGAIGGFIAGYNWRTLTERKNTEVFCNSDSSSSKDSGNTKNGLRPSFETAGTEGISS